MCCPCSQLSLLGVSTCLHWNQWFAQGTGCYGVCITIYRYVDGIKWCVGGLCLSGTNGMLHVTVYEIQWVIWMSVYITTVHPSDLVYMCSNCTPGYVRLAWHHQGKSLALTRPSSMPNVYWVWIMQSCYMLQYMRFNELYECPFTLLLYTRQTSCTCVVIVHLAMSD